MVTLGEDIFGDIECFQRLVNQYTTGLQIIFMLATFGTCLF